MSPVKKGALRTRRSSAKVKSSSVRKTATRRATTKRITPVRPKAPVATLNAAAARTLATKIDFRSTKAINASIKKLKIKKGQFAPAIGAIYKLSPANAEKFSSAAIKRWKKNADSRSEAREMIQWAKKAGPKQRQMMCKTFNKSGAGLIMVHGIGELTKTQARQYMKDYFKGGGNLKTVAQYLQLAGETLRKNKPKDPNTDGGVIDAVGGFFEDAADAVVDAVTTVVDAVVSAGRSLASVVNEAINWAASKVADLVEALIEAGKSVAAIMTEAARKGVSSLKKFAKAVLDVGRSVGELLVWVAAKAISTIREVINVVLRAGRSVYQIVKDAVRYSFNVVKKIVAVLIQMNKSLYDIMRGAVAVAYSALRNAVRAILQTGKKVADVINGAIGFAAGTLRNVVKALMSLGNKVVDILRTVSRAALEVVKKITDALFKLGKRLSAIIASAIKIGVSMVRRVANVLIKLRKNVTDILAAVARKTIAYMKAVVQGIIDAGRSIANILTYGARLVVRTFKKIVMALYQATRKATKILASVARRAVGTIRTVLEGLFAVGVQVFKAIKIICTDISQAFRKNFFQGLVEILKTPLKVLKEAAKAGGAILALAFSALLELWGGYRGLTAVERREARRVFGVSIDLDRVKITNAAIPADVINYLNGGRPFTTMYVINFSSNATVTLKTLVHELTHVWQGITAGPVYMVEALHAQLFGEGYTVTDAALAENNGDFSKFNREQQASIVDKYWYHRWGGGQGDFTKYQPYARAVYQAPRGARIRLNRRIPVNRTISGLSAVRIRNFTNP